MSATTSRSPRPDADVKHVNTHAEFGGQKRQIKPVVICWDARNGGGSRQSCQKQGAAAHQQCQHRHEQSPPTFGFKPIQSQTGQRRRQNQCREKSQVTRPNAWCVPARRDSGFGAICRQILVIQVLV